MREISKSFGAVRALSHVSIAVGRGECLGLVGDNAAGKSRLMKILAGAYQPDAGEILIEGERAEFRRPIDARSAGVEMIFQDFALIPQLTVTQNIFLGREWQRRLLGVGVLDTRAMDGRARELFATLGLRVPSVASAVRELSGGQQQAVAIARAIGFEAKVVIMDEPTANLGAPAIAKVREAIVRLKASGVAVIVISHRLEDIFAVGDACVVMKHGRIVGARRVGETALDEVVEMIVSGQDPRAARQPPPAP
jgi:simple sugar transport system ATP-binding protein